jgi:hypothetical protein
MHKTVEIKVFLNFFACWKDPDPYKITKDPDLDPKAKKHLGTDPGRKQCWDP